MTKKYELPYLSTEYEISLAKDKLQIEVAVDGEREKFLPKKNEKAFAILENIEKVYRGDLENLDKFLEEINSDKND